MYGLNLVAYLGIVQGNDVDFQGLHLVSSWATSPDFHKAPKAI